MDGDTFDAAACDLVVISFSRREVTTGQVGDGLDRLLSLSDYLLNVQRFRDSLTFVFEGYERDAHELHQVPEAVRFLRALTSRWPCWTHFAEKLGDTVSLVMTLLCDVDVVTTGAGITSYSLRDPAQLRAVLLHIFDGQNALYEACGGRHSGAHVIFIY